MKDEARVTIMIPTIFLERFEMLVGTIDSIQAGSYENIHVVIVSDGNLKLYEAVKTRNEWLKYENITVLINEKRMDWNASINRILKEVDSEYYIYASDDLVFPSDCIECAMVAMRKRFSDGFGVVSIGKKNNGAFGLFGRKWVDHFPGRQVMCPDLIHYGGDTELYRAANKLGKFAYPRKRESQVKHARPKDDTWRAARKAKRSDHAIFRKREEMGYTWGVDFNLITK